MGREQERSRMEDREGLVGPRIFFEEIVGPRICMLHVMSDTWAHGPSAIHNEKAQSMKRHRATGGEWDTYGRMRRLVQAIFHHRILSRNHLAGSTRTNGDILSRTVLVPV